MTPIEEIETKFVVIKVSYDLEVYVPDDIVEEPPSMLSNATVLYVPVFISLPV